jgi:hypothetical protein
LVSKKSSWGWAAKRCEVLGWEQSGENFLQENSKWPGLAKTTRDFGISKQ